MSHSNALSAMPTADQTVALIDARVIIGFHLEREMQWGQEDEYGSAHVPTYWTAIERLTRAFPDPFARIEDPLAALAEGC